jgi:hypothetical protein
MEESIGMLWRTKTRLPKTPKTISLFNGYFVVGLLLVAMLFLCCTGVSLAALKKSLDWRRDTKHVLRGCRVMGFLSRSRLVAKSPSPI